MSYYPYYPVSLLKKKQEKKYQGTELRKLPVQQITQEFQDLPEATLIFLPLYHTILHSSYSHLKNNQNWPFISFVGSIALEIQLESIIKATFSLKSHGE